MFNKSYLQKSVNLEPLIWISWMNLNSDTIWLKKKCALKLHSLRSRFPCQSAVLIFPYPIWSSKAQCPIFHATMIYLAALSIRIEFNPVDKKHPNILYMKAQHEFSIMHYKQFGAIQPSCRYCPCNLYDLWHRGKHFIGDSFLRM